MSAIKNGIKELHCKESLSGKRFKRSIAHNNLKLTCNIYHIQVFKLPFLQTGLYKFTSTRSGDEFSSLLNSVLCGCSESCTAGSVFTLPIRRFFFVSRAFRLSSFFLVFFFLNISVSCASCRGLRMGKRGSTRGGG